MQRAESNRVELLGHYASSLMMLGWDYQTHPPFHVYVGGVMAYEHTPGYLRNDADLRHEFPPRPLEGLDQALGWRTLEEITQLRQTLIHQLRRCRKSADANWVQAITEEIAELSQIYPSKFALQPNMCS